MNSLHKEEAVEVRTFDFETQSVRSRKKGKKVDVPARKGRGGH